MNFIFFQIENAGGEAKASGLLKHWQLVLYGTEESPVPISEKPQTSTSATTAKGEDLINILAVILIDRLDV